MEHFHASLRTLLIASSSSTLHMQLARKGKQHGGHIISRSVRKGKEDKRKESNKKRSRKVSSRRLYQAAQTGAIKID